MGAMQRQEAHPQAPAATTSQQLRPSSEACQLPFESRVFPHKSTQALSCQQAHLVSQQQEAGAAELPVHLQEPLGRGTGAGFVLCAQSVTQRLHLSQQHLQGGS